MQVLVKRRLGQVDRLAGEQRLPELPAVGSAGKLASWSARTRLVVWQCEGKRCAGIRSYGLACGWCAGALEREACGAALPETGITSNLYAPVFIASYARIYWPVNLKHR